MASTVVPTVIQALAKSGYQPEGAGKSAAPTMTAAPSSPAEGDEKFWGLIASVASTVVPSVIQALAKSGYQPSGAGAGAY